MLSSETEWRGDQELTDRVRHAVDVIGNVNIHGSIGVVLTRSSVEWPIYERLSKERNGFAPLPLDRSENCTCLPRMSIIRDIEPDHSDSHHSTRRGRWQKTQRTHVLFGASAWRICLAHLFGAPHFRIWTKRLVSAALDCTNYWCSILLYQFTRNPGSYSIYPYSETNPTPIYMRSFSMRNTARSFHRYLKTSRRSCRYTWVQFFERVPAVFQLNALQRTGNAS